jgi:hypothetical protein
MLQTNQKVPSVSSPDKGINTNADSSVDVWLDPKPPVGFEQNWVQTIPGKGWFTLLRLYGRWSPG